MAQQSQVPKFGTWESDDDVPYTAYFDNARKVRSGAKMNPNDSVDNSDIFSTNKPPVRGHPFRHESEPKAQKGPEAVRSKHERRISQEDGELRKLTDSPLRPDTASQRAAIDASHQRHGGVRSTSSMSESEAPRGPDAPRPRHERRLSREEGDLRRPTDSPLRHDAVGRRAIFDSPHRHSGIGASDSPKRIPRQGVGSDRSIEQSPLHSHHQARVGNKGSAVSSPSWERKGSSEVSHGLAPSTPGRTRLRSITRGDETPDNTTAVPKFGDWDESNPASAEGFSHIFDKVREEKQSGAGKVPVMATEASYSNGQKHYGNDSPKGCLCFPWGRK